MRHGRMALGLAVLSTALLVAGCGGGGGGTMAAGSGSALGSVISLDDSTADLSGVEVTDVRTGETCRTDANGDFDLGSVPAGTLTLSIGRDGPPADVATVEDGDVVNLRLRVKRGEIEESDTNVERRRHRAASFRLVPSRESDDEDVKGEGHIESNPEWDGIAVFAVHLDPGRAVEWFVVSPEGVEESEGVEEAGERGGAEWKMSTIRDGRLPFDARSVAALEGFGVEIRDAREGTLLLFGKIPPLPEPRPEPKPEVREWHGRAPLRPAEGVAGEASVGVESRKGEEPREVFAVAVAGQVEDARFTIWMGDRERDSLVEVGRLVVDGEGRGLFILNTARGDELPFGVETVFRLVGLAVVVRDEGGEVAYAGHVPELHPKR